MAYGVRYRPVDERSSHQTVEDVVRRLVALGGLGRSVVDEQPESVEALLGGVNEPKVTFTEALDIYFEEIAIDDQYGKSEAQAYQWRKVKRLSIS